MASRGPTRPRRGLRVAGAVCLLALAGVGIGFAASAGRVPGLIAGAAFALLALALWRLRAARRQIDALASRDPLTGLPNRAALERHARAAPRSAGGPRAIAVVAVDGLAELTETLGHRGADSLLATLAERLLDQLRAGDAVARVGGDELALVLNGCEDPDGALSRIRSAVERELTTGGLDVSVGVWIGYAVARDEVDEGELLRRAAVAAHIARARHAGVWRYDGADDPRDPAGLALAGELRRAIEGDELVLHYQPVAHVVDRRTLSLEAFVRWQHPSLGLLEPFRFVPLAARSSLIDRLTGWVVRRALRDAADLQVVAGQLPVSVNVPARTLLAPGLSDLVVAELASIGLPAGVLAVEASEAAVAADPAAAARALQTLRTLGVRTVVDQVASGPTALGALSALPIDAIKVDRSVVAHVASRRTNAAVVRSIATFGHALGLDVTAVGVETDAAWRAIATAGCDQVQGFALARPMDLRTVREWLATRRPVAATVVHRVATVS